MAILTLQNSNTAFTPINYGSNTGIDASATGWYWINTSTNHVFGKISGNSIQYDSYGQPVLGTITSATSINSDGSVRWTLSNLAIHIDQSGIGGNHFASLKEGNPFGYYMIQYLLNGNDTIIGSTGNDVIYYTTGSDSIDGGAGIDWMDFSTINYSTLNIDLSTNKYTIANSSIVTNSSIVNIENITGSQNDDSITGNVLNNILIGGGGSDVINGGSGIDTVIYSETSGVAVNLATGIATEKYGSYTTYTDTLTSIENIIGSSFDDVITGNSSNNVFTGGYGNDILDGGLGIDTALYSTAYKGVNVNLATGIATGHGNDTLLNIEKVIGSSYADTLTGSNGNDLLYGSSGNDILNGGAGNDVLDGGTGIDWAYYSSATSAVKVSLALSTSQVTNGAGSDTLTSIENLQGSKYNDTLTGSSAANTLNGWTGNDIINGGSGNDLLIGSTGKDTLTGGLGNDIFKYYGIAESAKGLNRDAITDFTRGIDKIDLSSIDANVFASGNQAFTLISSTTAFSKAAQIKFTGGILYGEVTGDNIVDFEIALTGITSLSSADFIL